MDPDPIQKGSLKTVKPYGKPLMKLKQTFKEELLTKTSLPSPKFMTFFNISVDNFL